MTEQPPAEPNPTGTLSLANRDHALGEMIRAISAAQLPVPAMPKLRRAKGGEYSRQEFLRGAEIATALSQRPAAAYMPGPLLAVGCSGAGAALMHGTTRASIEDHVRWSTRCA